MNEVQIFAQKTAVSEDAAKKIIKFLYQKWMDARLLDRVLRKLRDWIINNELQDIVDAMDDRSLEAVVGEVVMQEKKMRDSHNVAEFSEASPFDMRHFADLSIKKKVKAGDIIDVQIMRPWERDHQVYGQVKINTAIMKEVINNFKENKRGVKIFVDENHERDHKALAEFKELYMEWQELRAKLELNEAGAEALNKGYYHYFSPEIRRNVKDEETGQVAPVLLAWWAFTNRPFFKAMKQIMASEWAAGEQEHKGENPENYIFISQRTKNMTFNEIMAQLAGKDTITKAEKEQLEQAFSELPDDQKNDRKIKTKYEHNIEKFSEDAEGEKSAEGEAGKGDTPPVDGEKTADGEDGETEGEGEEGKKADEGKGDEPAPTADDPKPAGGGEEKGEPQKFTEVKDGQVVIEASELKTMQSTIAKLVREKRQKDLTEKVQQMQFSETAKPDSAVLPSMTGDIVNFAMSLSEAQAEKFLNIVQKFSDVRELFGEFGADGKDSTKKMQYNEKKHEELTKKYMDEEKMDFKEASRKALKQFDLDAK